MNSISAVTSITKPMPICHSCMKREPNLAVGHSQAQGLGHSRLVSVLLQLAVQDVGSCKYVRVMRTL